MSRWGNSIHIELIPSAFLNTEDGRLSREFEREVGPNGFTSALEVSPLADGRSWVLRAPFSYLIGGQGLNEIVVQKGFTTDFASVPWVLRIFIPRWGKYGNAAVLHDWLYWNQPEGKDRKYCDEVFLEAMKFSNVHFVKKNLIYWAVRLFGWIAWTHNRWDKKAGYNRVVSCEALEAKDKSKRVGVVRRSFDVIKNRSKYQ